MQGPAGKFPGRSHPFLLKPVCPGSIAGAHGGTLMAFSGIFFLYSSYEGLSGKWGLSAPCAPKEKTIAAKKWRYKFGQPGQPDGHFRDLFYCTFS